ncbi:MAG: hypothetical protein ABI175_15565, partial [Polyangiales bacterium]
MRSSARRPFTWERKGDHLVIAGSIDESAKLSELVSHASNGRLVLDLAGVSFINSIGVREWLRLQQAATDAKVVLELRRVAEVLIHQLN